MIKVLKKKEDLVHVGSATDEQIKLAEKELGLSFSKEYIEYLSTYGVASANGHEFTGIVKSKRLNVIDVTVSERDKNPYVSEDLYVLEKMDIDKIVIWQNAKGELFQTVGNGEPKKMGMSFAEFLG